MGACQVISYETRWGRRLFTSGHCSIEILTDTLLMIIVSGTNLFWDIGRHHLGLGADKGLTDLWQYKQDDLLMEVFRIWFSNKQTFSEMKTLTKPNPFSMINSPLGED